MFDLRANYDSMFLQAVAAFSAGKSTWDLSIDDVADDRMGLILNIRPNAQVRERIAEFQQKIKLIEPAQYYYPIIDAHFTVLAIVSCRSGFSIENVKIVDYLKIITRALKEVQPFNITCNGITGFTGGIMVRGYPDSEALEQIRENLRSHFGASSLFNTIDTRYRIRSAHSTVVRFRKPLAEPEKLITALTSLVDFDFGNVEVKELELVVSDWYQRHERTTRLSRFPLG